MIRAACTAASASATVGSSRRPSRASAGRPARSIGRPRVPYRSSALSAASSSTRDRDLAAGLPDTPTTLIASNTGAIVQTSKEKSAATPGSRGRPCGVSVGRVPLHHIILVPPHSGRPLPRTHRAATTTAHRHQGTHHCLENLPAGAGGGKEPLGCGHHTVYGQPQLFVYPLVGRRRTEALDTENRAAFADPAIPGLWRRCLNRDARHARRQHTIAVPLRLLGEGPAAWHRNGLSPSAVA